MATTAVFDVIDALFTGATTALPNVKVYDGFQLGSDPGPDILMIGVDDGNTPTAASSSDSNQEQATAGTPRSRNDVGTVNCWALSWNGNATPKAARDSVKVILAGVENMLRADPTLGIPRANGQVLTVEIDRVVLTQDQTDDGAQALLSFVVKYTARI